MLLPRRPLALLVVLFAVAAAMHGKPVRTWTRMSDGGAPRANRTATASFTSPSAHATVSRLGAAAAATARDAVPRSPRAASDTSSDPPIRTTLHRFKGDTSPTVHVYWLGEGSPVMFVHSIDSGKGSSRLYRSGDNGRSFSDLQTSSVLPAGARVNGLFFSHRSTVAVVDAGAKKLYITGNEGQSFDPVDLPFMPKAMDFHPTTPVYLMGHGGDASLWVSQNGGRQWRKLADGVSMALWGKETKEEVIYYISGGTPGQSGACAQRIAVDVPNAAHEQLRCGAIRLGVETNYTFVVSTDTEGGHSDGQRLDVSYDGSPLRRAVFDSAMAYPRAITVADASEGQIFAAVDHGANHMAISGDQRKRTHHLHISDATGTIFSKSMSNIVYMRVGSGTSDVVDFEPIEGVRGVYLANEETNETTVRSFITFDKGGHWHPIAAPQEDVHGNSIDCDPRTCALHFHDSFSYLFADDLGMERYQPILSSENAVGLIIATASFGETLHTSGDIYLSRDGGQSWKQVLAGPHYYAFGDHGGVIVAAMYNATKTLWYSVDEGKTFASTELSDKELFVAGIVTEPGSTTTVFSVFGYEPSELDWIVIQVDFKDFLGRECQAADYEMWSPSDTRTNDRCILGKRITYERRKPSARCFNGREYDRRIRTDSCLCTEEDFECDIHFARVADDGPCLAEDGFRPDDPPAPCLGSYEVSSGQRRVAGDECVDGVAQSFQPRTLRCPGKSNAGAVAGIAVSVTIACICVALALYYRRRFRNVTVRYRPLRPDSAPAGPSPAADALHGGSDDEFSVDGDGDGDDDDDAVVLDDLEEDQDAAEGA